MHRGGVAVVLAAAGEGARKVLACVFNWMLG
jgi:hypothetical protein